jgi:hypothetical protein
LYFYKIDNLFFILFLKTRLYCAQIRIGGTRPNVKYDEKFNDYGSQKLFWKFIRNEFINKKKDNDDWRLFITSDIESIELEAVKEFGEEKVIRIDGVNSHVDKEETNRDCTRIEKPILDFHFLQNCDKAVISQKSGFGQLGLWNRKNPYEGVYVFRNNGFYKSTEYSCRSHQLNLIFFLMCLFLIQCLYFLFAHFYWQVKINSKIYALVLAIYLVSIFWNGAIKHFFECIRVLN